MGSIKDVKKAPVENMARVIEILETLIAAKNVIQCKAMTMPAKKNFRMVLKETISEIFLILIKPNINRLAISMRYQTRGMASNEISSPRIAVNPAIKTRKCRCN
jgi:hypothetical protein